MSFMSPFSSGSHHQWAYNQSHYVFSLINIPNHSFSFCTHDLPLPALVSVTQGLSSGLMTSASRLFHLRGPFGRHLTWSSSSSLELRAIEKDLGGGVAKMEAFSAEQWAEPPQEPLLQWNVRALDFVGKNLPLTQSPHFLDEKNGVPAGE